MPAAELGPWAPLSLEDTVDVFSRVSFRWWITGGRALELHLGRSWRGHEDADVGVARRDTLELQAVLRSWDVYVAAAGQLEPWVGQELRAALHQNNLWCRPNAKRHWALDVTIGEGDGDAWIYRRDPRVRVPWDIAVLHTLEGVPYLAPELQLLYKSKAPREKDDFDAEQVVPELDDRRHERLAQLLPARHPWRRLLRAST